MMAINVRECYIGLALHPTNQTSKTDLCVRCLTYLLAKAGYYLSRQTQCPRMGLDYLCMARKKTKILLATAEGVCFLFSSTPPPSDTRAPIEEETCFL